MKMETNESWERFWEGLTRAASCCRELAKMTDAHEWKELSKQILIMRNKGKVIYDSPPLTELQVMGLVTKMEIAQLESQKMMGMVH